jgi:hypothetical protein
MALQEQQVLAGHRSGRMRHLPPSSTPCHPLTQAAALCVHCRRRAIHSRRPLLCACTVDAVDCSLLTTSHLLGLPFLFPFTPRCGRCTCGAKDVGTAVIWTTSSAGSPPAVSAQQGVATSASSNDNTNLRHFQLPFFSTDNRCVVAVHK